MSYEVREDLRNDAIGRRLCEAALRLVPEGEPLLMEAAPGNAVSLRSILAAGYRPVGSEVLFLRGEV